MASKTAIVIKEIKNCQHHGETLFSQQKSGKWFCCRCNIENVSNKRRRNKLALVKRHGGKCIGCGYNRCVAALDFHHSDPTQKEMPIGKAMAWSLKRLIEETDKCELLCANCHRERHAGFLPENKDNNIE